MSQYKEAEIGDTVYFWFAANTTAGAAGDGATPLYDVRLAGAAADAAPTASGAPTLLTHANYSDGLHEIAIDTTGWTAGEYAVFCTLTISTVNPAGFCGSMKLKAVGQSVNSLAANQTTILNRLGAFSGSGVNTILGFFKALLSKAASAPSDVGGTFDPSTDSVEAIRDTEPLGTAMRGTDSAALAATALTNATWTDARAAYLDAAISSRSTYAGGAVASVTAGVTVATNNDKAGYSLATAPPTASEIATAVGTRAPSTETYAVDGAIPTFDQFLFMIWSALAQFAITSTTISTKKLNGTTEAMTFTMDDATSPTSRVRST